MVSTTYTYMYVYIISIWISDKSYLARGTMAAVMMWRGALDFWVKGFTIGRTL